MKAGRSRTVEEMIGGSEDGRTRDPSWRRRVTASFAGRVYDTPTERLEVTCTGLESDGALDELPAALGEYRDVFLLAADP